MDQFASQVEDSGPRGAYVGWMDKITLDLDRTMNQEPAVERGWCVMYVTVETNWTRDRIITKDLFLF